MTTMRTHYDVLGVATDTPPVVLKAAYRALAKEYHPDRTYQGEADPGRFIEIQNAYAVLSDPAARHAYDDELRQSEFHLVPEGAGGDGSTYGPEIQRIHVALCLYSEALGAAFLRGVSQGANGDDPQAYGKMLEAKFFREYFGEDPDVQALARLFLLRSHTDAALMLNEGMAEQAAHGRGTIGPVLSRIIHTRLADEPLFAEWLRVKFGAESQPQPALPAGAAGAEERVKGSPAAYRPSHTPRSFALLCFWVLALYFALFAAFPLVQ